jgi:hypothetical protein
VTQVKMTKAEAEKAYKALIKKLALAAMEIEMLFSEPDHTWTSETAWELTLMISKFEKELPGFKVEGRHHDFVILDGSGRQMLPAKQRSCQVENLGETDTAGGYNEIEGPAESG